MKVKELIDKLQKLDGDLEVFIIDGHELLFYNGDFEVKGTVDDDGKPVADIGIGGMRWN